MSLIEFQFRPILTVVSTIVLVILLLLGNWQLQRLAWKRTLIAQTEKISTDAPIAIDDAIHAARIDGSNEYAAVRLTGVVTGSAEFVFGAIEGRPGVFFFMPVETPGGVIYVNRGFIPQADYKSGNFDRVTQGDSIKIEGLLRYPEEPRPPASWVVSRTQSSDGLWSIRDPRLFAKANSLAAISGFYVDAFAAPEIEYPRGGTTRISFSNRHLEYALTWFGLAGALLAIWTAMSFSKNK